MQKTVVIFNEWNSRDSYGDKRQGSLSCDAQKKFGIANKLNGIHESLFSGKNVKYTYENG